jgi:hypothetical protein
MIVKFLPLDITDEDSIETVAYSVDMCTQYGEDIEPRVRNCDN